jgi:hypothetical protein
MGRNLRKTSFLFSWSRPVVSYRRLTKKEGNKTKEEKTGGEGLGWQAEKGYYNETS